MLPILLTISWSVAFPDEGGAPPLCRLLTDEPISLSADRVRFDYTPVRRYTAQGNVEMRQGDLALTSNHLVIVYGDWTRDRSTEGRGKTFDKGLDMRFAASGNVKIVYKERVTMAEKITYDCLKGTTTIVK